MKVRVRKLTESDPGFRDDVAVFEVTTGPRRRMLMTRQRLEVRRQRLATRKAQNATYYDRQIEMLDEVEKQMGPA